MTKIELPTTPFEDLPIEFDDIEHQKGGWTRNIKREGSVLELLTVWDIDNPTETSAMAQALRHLKWYVELVERIQLDIRKS